MAIALTLQHHIWTRRGLNDLLKGDIPAAILSDSAAAEDLAKNPKINDRSKHIDIAFHFVRERIVDGSLILLHVPGTENLADICTKALPRPSHEYLCANIFGTK
jgi:hypothetical protein